MHDEDDRDGNGDGSGEVATGGTLATALPDDLSDTRAKMSAHVCQIHVAPVRILQSPTDVVMEHLLWTADRFGASTKDVPEPCQYLLGTSA